MGKGFILLVVGAIITALGVWYISSAGETNAGILAALIAALGGAIIVWGLAVFADVHSPTSTKL